MKVLVEITCEDNELGEIKRLTEDFCVGLQEDVSSDISFVIGEEDDDVIA